MIRPDAPGASLASIFEEQAARYPDRIAVISGETRLTYRALNQAANRIAQIVLAHRGPGEATVALLFRPGPSIVTAILGVLKAGKIYVALDPTYPQPRTAYMLADSEARLLLTDTRHLALAGELAKDGQDVVDCDAIDPSTVTANLSEAISGTTAAFLLYTSGSTGHPKGVLHNHRNVLVEVRNYVSDVGIGPDDRLSVWHSLSFSNSIRNLYGALLNGAAVCLYDLPGQGLMPLAEWIRSNQITMIHTLGSTFRALVGILPADATFPSVRVLRIGGESITGDDVRKYQSHFPPPCVLLHSMGPTETFSVRRLLIDHEWKGDEGKVPVGYAVTDKEVLLLDEQGQPVGPGQIGEIVVRSRYLAIGYWRQPELTAAAFAADPLGGEERLYYTGDLGVMQADGCLTHLGRKDFQAKIRGHRVETGEIEAALSKLESVKAAVVHAQPDGDGEQRLVAYVIADPGMTATIHELRGQLAQTLPEFMVPSSFVFLEELPLLPNGKINRLALPVPSVQRPALPVTYKAPRHPLEWQIALIWRELLKVPKVGVFDDFFDLGGHSLLAVRLMQRLETEVGSRLPLTALFSAPTVAGLAAAVQGQEATGSDLVVPLRASGSEPAFFFFHGDYNGGGFYSRILARGLPTEQPFYAVHPHPLTDRRVPDTVAAMVTDLVAAIRAVQPRGPYRLGGHCNGGTFAFEVARRLVAEGDEVNALVIIDASARNARFRLVSRLARALAWVGRLDRGAEGALFLRLRDRATELAGRRPSWRRRRAVPATPAHQPVAPAPAAAGAHTHPGDDLDLAPGAPVWQESERVAAFRQVARCHVPGRYAGSIALLVPEGRRPPRRDLWWSLVAGRVEVHTIPGAHLTSITEHGAEVAEQLQACLAAARAARG
jgi:amino acid adenylation domain-containing protein